MLQRFRRFVYSSNSVRLTNYRLYKYNDDFCRLVKINSQEKKGFEEIKKFKEITVKEEYESEVERTSISRSKRNIRELALSNDFEYFATITVNSEYADRFRLDSCQELLRKKFKKLKRINNNFGYVFITEKHKNGAFHFHGLVKGIEDFYINDNGYLSHHIFDEIGFNSFSAIKDYVKCCNYITKYITKECVKNSAGMTYISSRGLKKADVYDYSNIEFNDWTYENDFCKIKDFLIAEMPRDLLLQLTGGQNEKI